MGVSRLFQIKCEEISKSYQDLLRRVESLGCKRFANFKVECKVLSRSIHSVSTIYQKIYVVRSSHQEEVAFSFLLNSKELIKIAKKIETNQEKYFLHEGGIPGLLAVEKLGLFAHKLDCCFEGTEYVSGDFSLRIGIIKERNNFPKSLVIVVEFVACPYFGKIENAIQEFLTLLGENESSLISLDDLKSVSFIDGLGRELLEKQRAFQYVLAINKRNV